MAELRGARRGVHAPRGVGRAHHRPRATARPRRCAPRAVRRCSPRSRAAGRAPRQLRPARGARRLRQRRGRAHGRPRRAHRAVRVRARVGDDRAVRPTRACRGRSTRGRDFDPIDAAPGHRRPGRLPDVLPRGRPRVLPLRRARQRGAPRARSSPLVNSVLATVQITPADRRVGLAADGCLGRSVPRRRAAAHGRRRAQGRRPGDDGGRAAPRRAARSRRLVVRIGGAVEVVDRRRRDRHRRPGRRPRSSRSRTSLFTGVRGAARSSGTSRSGRAAASARSTRRRASCTSSLNVGAIVAATAVALGPGGGIGDVLADQELLGLPFLLFVGDRDLPRLPRAHPAAAAAQPRDAAEEPTRMSQKLAERAAKLLGRAGTDAAQLPAEDRDRRQRGRGRAEGLPAPARLRVRGALRVRGPELRVRVAVLRRLHRVLLHDDRHERLPARHDRRGLVEGRRLAVLQRPPLLHRLQRDLPVRGRRASAPTTARTRRGAAAAATATATTARPAARSSATASATSRSGRSGASRAGSSRAIPRCSRSSNCAPTLAVDNSTANHNKPCLQAPPPRRRTTKCSGVIMGDNEQTRSG